MLLHLLISISNAYNSFKARPTAVNSRISTQSLETSNYKLKIVWSNVVLMSLLHLSALYGIWITLTIGKWQTIYAMYFFGITSAMGVLAGAHRLWSHRSYKAKWQLRVFHISLICYL